MLPQFGLGVTENSIGENSPGDANVVFVIGVKACAAKGGRSVVNASASRSRSKARTVAAGAQAAATAFVNIGVLKQHPPVRQALEQTPNPLVALLLAGVTESLRSSNWLALGLSAQLRVRHHGQIARLEIDPRDMPQYVAASLRQKIVAHFRTLGFQYVALDLEGYSMGSLNRTLGEEK